MKKPAGFEEAQVMGDFVSIKEGEHHLIIRQVNKTQSKSGKDMVIVLFDFADNDAQKGLIANDFKNDTRTDKKWPHRGTAYIMVYDWQNEDKTSKNFKTFCTCFERSNDTTINWVEDDNAWAAQFKGKRIGGAFGKVHSVYEGKEQIRTEFRWFVSDGTVDPDNVPNEKMLSEAQKAEIIPDPSAPSASSSGDGFMSIPDVDEDEIPF